ncbi:MAG TPA: FecR domain-containing protein [Cyclobacteriaceae bacterium]|jgi:ferric-dicitrate binding protein FerR (iron transport regulator)|nr:FecR domain-containing protein [Cyclobacteriaceae bacterium]
MNQKDKVDDNMIAKFLAGEATPDEAILVTNWMDESAENKLLFDQSQRTFASQNYTSVNPEARAKMWESIIAHPHVQSTRSSFFTPLKLAATLLVLISIGAVIYLVQTSSTASEEAWITKNSNEGIYKLPLPEGTAIVMNKKSSLTYPKYFNQRTRTVKLSGEAFFDVAHQPDQPFIVDCAEVSIKVLGTAFNISCLNNSAVIETQVTRGKVLMYSLHDSIRIEAGWVGSYDRPSKQMSLRKSKNQNHIGYATHTFAFEDIPLKEVAENLSNSFGVSFVFENETLKNCRLTSEYHDKSLTFILTVIAESLNLKYTVKGNTVYLSGDGCL